MGRRAAASSRGGSVFQAGGLQHALEVLPGIGRLTGSHLFGGARHDDVSAAVANPHAAGRAGAPD